MPLPEDPIILLSYINTKLRDVYSSFEDFCLSESADGDRICKKLAAVGYEYSSEQNRFI